MRAILIDPFNKTVTEVEYDGDIKTAYKLTGCELLTVSYIGQGNDGIFVDDEGLFNQET